MKPDRGDHRRRVEAPVLAVFLTLVVASIALAPVASAHSAPNSPASNLATRLISVKPALPGVRLRVIEAGSRLELTWRSGPEILVRGYEDEPYLRVGPLGVLQNAKSPSVAVNRDRMGTRADPNADSNAPPRWQRVSTGHTARWHDHRIHYMGAGTPDAVRGQTGRRVHIQDWTVTVVSAGVTSEATGTLDWVPGPSPTKWLVFATLVALVLLGLAFSAPDQDARDRLRPIIAAALLALVAVDAIHLAGISFGVRASFAKGLGRMLSVGYVSVAAWVIALVAIGWYLRRRDDALYLVTFAAALMLVVGGLADLTILSRTSIAFAGRAQVARWCVALTLGLGVGLAGAGLLLTRPPSEPLPGATADPITAL